MFRKLLKYDMKSVWKVWRIMAVILLGLSVVGSFVLRYILENFDKMLYSTPLSMMFSLFMLTAFMSILAAYVITIVFVFLRFYKNFFTDEGYLTFTLPVTRGTLLRSKTVNAIIWMALLFVLYLVCAIPFAVISPPTDNGELFNPCVFEFIGEMFEGIWESFGAWTVVYAVEAILFCVISVFYSIATFQLCITVGSILVKKAKVLLGIGIYYGFSMVTSTVSMVLRIVFFLTLSEGFSELLARATENEIAWVFALGIMVVCMAMVAFALIIHSVTRMCIERKLNLA